VFIPSLDSYSGDTFYESSFVLLLSCGDDTDAQVFARTPVRIVILNSLEAGILEASWQLCSFLLFLMISPFIICPVRTRCA